MNVVGGKGQNRLIAYTKHLTHNSGYNRKKHIANKHPVKQR